MLILFTGLFCGQLLMADVFPEGIGRFREVELRDQDKICLFRFLDNGFCCGQAHHYVECRGSIKYPAALFAHLERSSLMIFSGSGSSAGALLLIS